jgi:hypothetical protein
VSKDGEKIVLEGVRDVGGDGKPVGDAKGERIVLIEGRGPLGSQPAASSETKADTENTGSSSGPSADEI